MFVYVGEIVVNKEVQKLKWQVNGRIFPLDRLALRVEQHHLQTELKVVLSHLVAHTLLHDGSNQVFDTLV